MGLRNEVHWYKGGHFPDDRYDWPVGFEKPFPSGRLPRCMTDDWDAVFWDIGGVILDVESVRAGHRAFVADLIETHDLDASLDEALGAWRTTVGTYFRERDGTEFRRARRAYALGVEAIVGERRPEPEWWPLLREAVAQTRTPNPGAVETITALDGTDLHLGVVSDIDAAEGRDVLEGFDVRRHFDAVTTSEAVGRTKPDPAMFETALDAAGVDPDRALMVGDRYEHDVAGAARVGIHPVAYGAAEGPTVEYRISDLRELLDVVGVDRH